MSSRTLEDGLTLHLTLIHLQGSDGVYEIAANHASSVLWPLIETQHDTGVFVRTLILDVPAGKNLYAYRKMLSIEDFLKLWGKVNGVAVRFREISFDEMVEAAGMLGREGAEAFAYAADFGYEGRDDPTVVHPKDVSHSFYEFLRRCRSNSLVLVGRSNRSPQRRGLDQEAGLVECSTGMSRSMKWVHYAKYEQKRLVVELIP